MKISDKSISELIDSLIEVKIEIALESRDNELTHQSKYDAVEQLQAEIDQRLDCALELQRQRDALKASLDAAQKQLEALTESRCRFFDK